MSFELTDYQLDAVHRMHNGCLLKGGTGSGKSLTSIAYYYLQNGGDESFLLGKKYKKMRKPKDLYIITTAQKRDKKEWEKELSIFLITNDEKTKIYKHKVVIDSWQNIKKYVKVQNAFFILDEDHITGSGTWVQSFLKIAKVNEWIVLSATPGDKWEDYIPIFIANGFYKSRTQFIQNHIIYKWPIKYHIVDRYLNTGRLIRLRKLVLVEMKYQRKTNAHYEYIYVSYDREQSKLVTKERKNPFNNFKPIKSVSEYCYVLRKITNSDISRQIKLMEVFEKHPTCLIFYNFDYELDILLNLFKQVKGVGIAQWNGHKHEPIPNTDSWVYLINYNAGSEGFNCIETNTIIFYSLNYSYKTMTQAAGRIDRMNTPFSDLYYYYLKSNSMIDRGIIKALSEKKDFNEGRFAYSA